MSQNIRITITPDLERALNILRQSTTGTLNTTELIKLAVGELAQLKKAKITDLHDEITPQEMDNLSAHLFYEWAKEDNTLDDDNISPNATVKPFIPELYVPNR
ncbi:MAG TPA: hypothetical protein VNW29_04445 [Candidatus Sulfotelmatobacter sp.]|jgi:hypothetical protein|nr:hypothetical protein [Candidatus Sulfotelmatobacter sp.]